jgi:spermidine/putrescine ABC transporter ATP-binding subunit
VSGVAANGALVAGGASRAPGGMPVAESEGNATRGASLELRGVSRRFANGVVAVDGIDLSLVPGEFFSLLGPSGCGKTTTLRMIAGFEHPDSGRVVVAGSDITDVPVHRRGLGMVFQSYALLPHRTVFENVAFGLRMRGISAAAIRPVVIEALRKVHLTGYEDRRPSQLSGGQQQRVALARAIAIGPAVLLCDEPLGALDRRLRQSMQFELKALQRELGITLVFVTHDQEEALAMSDRIGVMQAGKLAQIGAPLEIYERPASRFVADFIGDINVIDGEIRDGMFAGDAGFRMPIAGHTNSRAALAVRPEHMRIGAVRTDEPSGVLIGKTYLGDQTLLAIETERAQPLLARLPSAQAALTQVGARVGVSWDPERAVILTS